MGTHPIFESDFDCLTEMKLGATVIVAASAQGFGGATTGLPTAMPTVGTRPTRSPEYVYTTPERPRSPQPTMNHQSPHHTGSPHSGRPERPEGGCSDRAMMQWRAAMKQCRCNKKNGNIISICGRVETWTTIIIAQVIMTANGAQGITIIITITPCLDMMIIMMEVSGKRLPPFLNI